MERDTSSQRAMAVTTRMLISGSPIGATGLPSFSLHVDNRHVFAGDAQNIVECRLRVFRIEKIKVKERCLVSRRGK
jgi:hypothetical protein